jgi:hypothetical protein
VLGQRPGASISGRIGPDRHIEEKPEQPPVGAGTGEKSILWHDQDHDRSVRVTEIADRFAGLQKRLPGIWSAIVSEPACAHTSIILPSFSVDQDELNKVVGAVHYEERLLFALIRLRNPNARLIYISSQPIHPDIVD